MKQANIIKKNYKIEQRNIDCQKLPKEQAKD